MSQWAAAAAAVSFYGRYPWACHAYDVMTAKRKHILEIGAAFVVQNFLRLRSCIEMVAVWLIQRPIHIRYYIQNLENQVIEAIFTFDLT